MMLEEEIELHRFAGISPEQSFTEAGHRTEAAMDAKLLGINAGKPSAFAACPPLNSTATVAALAEIAGVTVLRHALAFRP